MKIYQALQAEAAYPQPASAKDGTVNSIIVDDCQSEAAQNSTILSGHIKLASKKVPAHLHYIQKMILIKLSVK